MRFAHCLTAALAAMMMATMLPACAPTATQESTGEYVDDAVITTRVKAAYATDPMVKATEVKVETYKGIVQLSGFVDTPEAKRRAEELARQVKGVRDVKNDIVVKTAVS